MSQPLIVDPAVYDPASIHPETTEFNAQLETMLNALPAIYEAPVALTRQAREDGKGAFGPLVVSPNAEWRAIPGPAGPLRLRVFRPDTVRGVYYHIHGGGWAIGGAHHHDQMLETLARHCGVAVVSVEYRLAPEHPYPAGPDDCEAAALWLHAHAKAEFGADRLAIGGESAGAHLAVVTLLRLRDKHGLGQRFAAANLVYGCYDLRGAPSVERWGDRRLILNTPIIHWFLDQFVPASRRGEPDVSPLLADLAGLGPARFTVGTLDPLLDDTLFMATRWQAAGGGNTVALKLYPGGVHGFDNFPIALARQARADINDWLAAQFR